MKAKPLAMNMTPKVTMKAGILKKVIILPVPIPIKPHKSTAAEAPTHRSLLPGDSPPKACMTQSL